MTLLQIRNIIDYILSLQQNPIKLTKERYVDILGMSSLMYFEEQLRLKNWDNLKPFIKIKGDYSTATFRSKAHRDSLSWSIRFRCRSE